MKKLYVFDLDGTLADLDHRLHHIKQDAPDWDEFYDACDGDNPIAWVCDLIRMAAERGNILILSGRSAQVRKKTLTWLEKHSLPFDFMRMRNIGDFTPDHMLKLEMLKDFLNVHHDHEVQFIVEDRQRVVDMWRANGYNVLQCQAWEEA